MNQQKMVTKTEETLLHHSHGSSHRHCGLCGHILHPRELHKDPAKLALNLQGLGGAEDGARSVWLVCALPLVSGGGGVDVRSGGRVIGEEEADGGRGEIN